MALKSYITVRYYKERPRSGGSWHFFIVWSPRPFKRCLLSYLAPEAWSNVIKKHLVQVRAGLTVQGGSDKSGFFFFFLLNGTTQLKISRFYWSKKINSDTYWQSKYSIKLPSAVKRASFLDLKLMQTFATVSLARDPITSFIFWIRSLDLLRDFALTHNSKTPHAKIVQRAANRWAGRPDLLLPQQCSYWSLHSS